MTPSPSDTNLFLEINGFAQRTAWLHAPLAMYAKFGILFFAGLLVAGWWAARRRGIARMVALVCAGLGTVVAVAVNQPLVQLFHEARPYTHLHQILVLAQPSVDFGFPSDHGTMAGAVTAGLFLVDPLLGSVSLLLALLMAFSRVYIAAHYPSDVVAGLLLGAAVVLLGHLVVRKPLTQLMKRMARSRLQPLVTDAGAAGEG
ncbi:phosphatase PAP2 family protein [Intrasporangium calvum]|uniref:Phosphoesterase PA-phosphatase related protein n=1 Tax=Intrasporangium calvum (strain ATCC 23552 / DSM 43043 / JCM 3097 / NBRC 12989 / NCIMB 10167 / NRRL B-3866 / 7 KIP) TaxID=710696 RepID=E6SAT0_INTC7|nr:phosphatase PAP2 family protein [Intrasporangium calvum]ADU49391.1 phosphoesterase PA-phosphatase related protein [Intrasporangium calvum DSM 43043]